MRNLTGSVLLMWVLSGCSLSGSRALDEQALLASSTFYHGETALPLQPPLTTAQGTGEEGYIPPPTQGDGEDSGEIPSEDDIPIDVDIPRVCTWHWEPLFFEDCDHPILTVEAEPYPGYGFWCPPEMAALCGGKNQHESWLAMPTPLGGAMPFQPRRDRPLVLASASMRGRNVMGDDDWQQSLRLRTRELRDQYPNWQEVPLRARVCDDWDRRGSCRGRSIYEIASVSDVDFLAGRVPERLQVDVISHRIGYDRHYYTDLPEWCEELISPLVLDLDGDGISLSSPRSGVRFDLNRIGIAVRTGWTWSDDDALLARDLNGNGRIDDGAELFGSATDLTSGARAENGFEALADLDSDGDGLITPSDRAWDTLLLWLDANHNGRSEPQELSGLDRSGLDSINLGYVAVSETDPFGNQTRQRSTFHRRRGGFSEPALIIDAWFRTFAAR